MGTFSTKNRNCDHHADFRTTESELPEVISLLSIILEKTIQKNDKYVKKTRKKATVTVFHGSRPPALSIKQYLERIYKYSRCSDSCFVVAYVYLDRFLQVRDSYITTLNAHRLIITCVLLAAKFLDDESYNNAYYAKIGGISTSEMNRLELNLLFALDFRLHVTLDTFNQYSQLLHRAGASPETLNRSATWHIRHAIQTCTLNSNSKFGAYISRAG